MNYRGLAGSAIKGIADEAILSDLNYRGLVARGLAGSAIKGIADEAILSDLNYRGPAVYCKSYFVSVHNI